MSRENFNISYDGPALVSHEMDIKELAPALLSLGELFEEANKALNGDRVKVSVNIKATSPGSLDISFALVQDILEATKTLFSSDEVSAIVNAKELLGLLFVGCSGSGIGLFKLINWLKNRNIKNVTKIEDGRFKLTTEDGEIQYTNEKEIKLFGLINIRKKIESVVKPLKRDGIDKIKISNTCDGQVLESQVDKESVDYFDAPKIDEEIIDEKEIEMSLQIVNLSFQKDGKWKFSDGNSSFFAEVIDESFNKQIEENEKVFAKDDLLKVVAIRRQSLVMGVIKTDYIIKTVLEHRSAAIQIKLPFDISPE